ncbi:hypothetical protein BKA62DRAFT_713839 [Auriculariales sp. MPI-PUGE-AT-0066]|nr:hypothetical protein BKA62DRAFT_713839 [Auriculariales sp. MPI-PUGE-AT-0066]
MSKLHSRLWMQAQWLCYEGACTVVLLVYATLTMIRIVAWFFVSEYGLGEVIRTLKHPGNTHVIAGQMPPEILVIICTHLRRTTRYSPILGRMISVRPVQPYADLIHVQRVCRTWSAAATVVIYRDLQIRTTRCAALLTQSLSKRPSLLQHIVKVEFWPCDILGWQHAEAARPEFLQQLIDIIVQAADVNLPFLSSHLQLVQYRDGLQIPWQDDRFLGLVNCSPRTTHLQLYAESIDRGLLHDVPVTLYPFPRLQQLCLQYCEVTNEWVEAVCGGDVPLQKLELDLDRIIRRPSSTSISTLIQPVCNKLSELIFHDRSSFPGQLATCVALTSLTLSAVVFQWHDHRASGVPPALEELRLWTNSAASETWSMDPRQGVLFDVQGIHLQIGHWKAKAPRLHLLELYDSLDRRNWPTWTIAGFLLQATLARKDITLRIHLGLSDGTVRYYREVFREQRKLRWLSRL